MGFNCVRLSLLPSKTSVPEKKQEIGLSFEIYGSSQKVQQQIGNPTPRMQFLSEDEKSLIQLSTDVLSINKLKPYHSWEDFKETNLFDSERLC